eukprot:TRINITY_DN96253_c0_g1_i1.p1 TRINITY_DN96253_c0_g1~~TRINITY_DN96253_c0_g1_i1.p1  ORF type:complete len:129 (-),score=7.67 TRINITY_DN96253_c0_g1_i1:131-517(-)
MDVNFSYIAEVDCDSAEFQRRFNLPPTELVQAAYSCAYSKVILRQGRLYLSKHYIAFYSRFGGKFCIPLMHMSSVQKKRTAFVLDNAIQITACGTTYFLTSLLLRDQAFKCLMDLWNHQQAICSCTES